MSCESDGWLTQGRVGRKTLHQEHIVSALVLKIFTGIIGAHSCKCKIFFNISKMGVIYVRPGTSTGVQKPLLPILLFMTICK
jgi:hypothetical protein